MASENKAEISNRTSPPLKKSENDPASGPDPVSENDPVSGPKTKSADLPAKKPTPRRAGDVVTLRNQGLYAVYRKLLSLTIISSLVVIFGIGVAVFANEKRTPPQYIPITDKNEILQPIPINQPNKSNASILEFSLKAVRAVNTYDYINYRDQLQDASSYFTPTGWSSYTDSFMKQGTIKKVLEEEAIVSITIRGEIQIKNQGVSKVGNKDVYVWLVTLPVSIHYTFPKGRSASSAGIDQNGTVSLYVVRMGSVESPNGIGVEVYQMELDKI